VVDLTIVSCFAPSLGGRNFEAAAELFQPLLAANVPVVVYVEDIWKEPLRTRYASDCIRLHETSARRRLEAFAFKSEIAVAWAASTHPDLPSLDYFVTTLTKMGMLHDQSIWNPFGTRYLTWIDADVCASVQPRYFTDEHLLDALPCLLRRFLFLTRPSEMTDAAGTPGASRVQTQLFGGELSAIPHTNAIYYQLLEHALRAGRLPTDESLFTQVLERSPERFDRFVLQENGLLGFLFEEMRTGRVSLERTMVC